MALRLRVGVVMRAQNITTPKEIRAFAERAGIAENTARNLYYGATTRVDMPIIDKVARALDIHPMELFEEVPDDQGQGMPGTLQVKQGAC